MPPEQPPQTVSQQVQMVIAGDPEAGAWFYDAFAPRLFRLLRQRYGPDGELNPDDLLQDAFVFFLQNRAKALRDFLDRHAETERTDTALFHRLWALTRGVAANRLRAHKRRAHSPLPEYDEVVAAVDTEREAMHRQLLGRLDACLKGGNPRVYLYYKFRYHDGLAPEQIAQATGWSRKAVYKLKAALDQAVRECAENIEMQSIVEEEAP